MKKSVVILLGLLVTFCSSPSSKTMNVSGSIEGLRKGTLYLQKLQDTLLVTVDSLQVNGNSEFTLGDNLESPEFYFLALNKSDQDSLTEKILFFGDRGEIKINTLLNTFSSSAKIEGSKNHDLWTEYQSVIKKFNNQNLDLLEDYLEQEGDFAANNRQQVFDEKSSTMLRRKYLYTINYAMNNADKEIAAYLGAYELSNAGTVFLDSLYSTLSSEVKMSKYGVEFKQQLDSLVR